MLLSHSHPDHYGLIERVHPSVPLYMGIATEAILKEAAFFTPLGLDREATKSLTDGELLRIGPFAVTPILVDHSAFDAYALLIEGRWASTPLHRRPAWARSQAFRV